MLNHMNDLLGYELKAADGEIGKVQDLYFDDHEWIVRYLVVETGSWFSKTSVLISPASAGIADEKDKVIPVQLDRKQIKDSPPIDTRRPVSKEMELRLAQHYSWPVYWSTAELSMASTPLSAPRMPPRGLSEKTVKHPTLRSLSEVTGYHISAEDDSIGHVEEFLYDPLTWRIQYMVVDTRNWLPGKKVLVAPEWIRSIAWEERNVHVDLPKQNIQEAPEFVPPMTTAYEEKLYEHYDRVHPDRNSKRLPPSP